MQKPRRVLIIRPSALGDVCRSVPVLASLRAAWPDARLDWIVQEEFTDAIAAHPALDEAIPFARGRWRAWWRKPSVALEIWRWLRSLRGREYDLVLDCQGLGRSGLMTWATAARRRIGHRSARECAWIAYTERIPDGPQATHTVDRMLSLVAAAGAEVIHDMQLYTAVADDEWWSARRQTARMPDTRYAVLAPTSRWGSKRWPVERWIELVDPLRERGFDSIVIIGAPGEESQVAPLLEAAPDAIDLVGRASIGQTMSVIRESDLVIANDSAPLHMAVGFDRPCIALFGPTDPELVGPYNRPGAVVRCRSIGTDGQTAHYKDARLGDRLMQLITPGDVIERIDAVLGDGR